MPDRRDDKHNDDFVSYRFKVIEEKLNKQQSLFFWFNGIMVTVLISTILGCWAIINSHDEKVGHLGSEIALEKLKTEVVFLKDRVSRLSRGIQE